MKCKKMAFLLTLLIVIIINVDCCNAQEMNEVEAQMMRDIERYRKMQAEYQRNQFREEILRLMRIDDYEESPEDKYIEMKNLGPETLDVLMEIAEENYRGKFRSNERYEASLAVFYLGYFKDKKSVPLLKNIMEYLNTIPDPMLHFREMTLEALLKTDCEASLDFVKDKLDAKKTPDQWERERVAGLMKECSTNAAADVLKKAMKSEPNSRVVLFIDDSLVITEPEYRSSKERKQILESKKPKLTPEEKRAKYKYGSPMMKLQKIVEEYEDKIESIP